MEFGKHLNSLQRESLWKWRWLGWSGSTPAFKASIVALGIAAVVVALLSVLMR